MQMLSHICVFAIAVSEFISARKCFRSNPRTHTPHSAIRQQQPALKEAEGCLEIKVITQIEPYGLNISELKFTRQ